MPGSGLSQLRVGICQRFKREDFAGISGLSDFSTKLTGIRPHVDAKVNPYPSPVVNGVLENVAPCVEISDVKPRPAQRVFHPLFD